MDWVKEYAAWNAWYVMYFYWLPLILCLIGHSRITIREILQDIKKREEYLADQSSSPTRQRYVYYSPSVTLGTIMGRLCLSVTPIVNTLRAWSLIPEYLGWIIPTFEKIFDIPLVPKPKEKNGKKE